MLYTDTNRARAQGITAATDHAVAGSPAFRYDAFISYRHVEPDRGWAKWLHAAMEAYRTPSYLVKRHGAAARIRRVFRDEEELHASSDLSAEIGAALRASRFLIVVCSPRVAQSRWVDEEVRRFRQLGRGSHILTLLVEGEPDESFPGALRESVNESGPLEPLAADVRPALDGEAIPRTTRRLALLRLVAAVHGVHFDDLRQRERLRRRRRAGIAAATIFVLLVLGGYFAQVLVRSRNLQRIGTLTGRLQAELDRGDFAEAHLRQIQSMAGDLERVSPDSGAAARGRINARFADYLRDCIRRPTLLPADVQGIRHGTDILAGTDPSLAEQVRKALADRLSDWQQTVELAPPFPTAAQVFATGAYRTDATGLRVTPDALPNGNESAAAATAIDASGNVRIELTCDAPSGPDPVGVAIGYDPATDRTGYFFVATTTSLEIRRGDVLLAKAPYQMPSPLSVAPPVAPLISAPATSPAGPDSAAAVHLLSLIDDKELAVADWARRGAAVVSHDGDAACLTLPYAAPEEYDLAVEFSRLTGDGDVLAEFPVGKGTCDFVVGGDNNQHAWLGRIAHKWSEGNPTLTDVSVSKNQRHRMEVKVRRNGVEGYLDGKRLCHWRTNGNDMESHKSYLPHNPALMAIGSRRNAVAFYSVEVATPQNADPTSTPHSAEPAAVVLRLTAQRAGRRLSFQLGGEPPVAFEDVFATPPAPASVVAVLGRRVNVRELRAWRQTPPHVPSLMERGDGLYEAKDFTAALAEYQGQMNSAMSKDRHEAAFKGAVCLAALHRDDEAESEFEKLVATGGDDWTVQAGCQLWLLDLNHGRYTEAEGLFERLLPAGFDFSRLATLVPSDVRDPILKHYELAAGSANFLFLDRKKIEDLERLVAVEDLLNAYLVGLTSRVSLVHAYELTGRPELALKVAREAVRSDPLASVPSVALCEEVATLLRHSGQPGNALNRLNDWIAHAPAGRFGDLRHLLLIERAKTHLALNQEAEAERDLKAFFDAADSGDINAMAYRFWGPACLLQGFILSDRGDEAGAREAWRKGVIKADGTGHANALDTLNNLEAVMGSTTASACASMLGGLSGEWSDADGDVYMHLMLQRVSAGQQMLSPLLAGLHAPASSIYQPWKTAQGRDVARRFALGRMDRHESAVAMHALILADILGRSTGGEFTSDEQGLYDAFAADLIERIASQRLSTTQMVQLAASWKGISGMLGWGGLQGSLDPELRAPLAYAMGRRYTTLGHASQAKAFFKLAASDAKPGSMTQKLADRRAQAGTANSPAQ